MTTITSLELWRSLGEDAYTKVRSEAVGTGNGVTSTWSLDFDNVITDSTTVYQAGVEVTTSYTIDLDDGDISGLTASSGSAVTADYSYSDIPDTHIQEVLNEADELLYSSTGRIFATTTTTEYLNVEDVNQDEYFLKHWPAITISYLAMNQESEVDTPDWSSSTQGLGNDFLTNDEDLLNGRFRIIDNFPANKGKDMIKVTYSHGYATTPYRAKELATLLSQKILMQSTISKSIFKGRDEFTIPSLEEINGKITQLTNSLKSMNIEKP